MGWVHFLPKYQEVVIFGQQHPCFWPQLETAKELLALDKKGKDEETAKFEGALDYVGKLGDIFKLQANHYKWIKKMDIIPKSWLVRAAGFAAIIEYTVTKFLEFDKAMAKFRIQMGLLREDSKRISDNIKSVYVSFVGIGVTIEGAVVAAEALANEFGGTMKISKDLIETTAIFKSQLGVAEDATAGFLRNISAISKTTAQSNKHIAYFASRLSAAAGVPLNMVMQDVSKLSGNALSMVSRMPGQLIKAAVEARVLGTTLNKMADASRHLLNFTESIQQEMDASVLVGRNINLQKARELAYRRDLVGSTKEILRIAKNINFENLDVFQMDAFAAATGRSTDELLKMIQAQRQLEEARNIDGLKDEVREYERLKGIREGDLKNVGLQRELQVKQMANQERIAALQQQWNKLLLQATATLFPILDATMKIAGVILALGPVLMSVIKLVEVLSSRIGRIAIGAHTLGGHFLMVWELFKGGIELSATLSKWIAKIGKAFSVVFKVFSFAKTFAPFLEFIPVVGWIITGLTLLCNLFKRISTEGFSLASIGKAIVDTFWQPFVDAWEWIKSIFVANSPSVMSQGIVDGIIAVKGLILNHLLSPFKDAYTWIMDRMGGHSASELMLSVIRGIIGGGAKLLDVLTSPFRQFFAWVLEKIPFVGKNLAKGIRGGYTGALENLGVLEKKITTPELIPTAITTEAVTAKSPTITPTIPPTLEESKQQQQNSTTLAAILKELCNLNADLTAGKIAVNMDGMLVSAQMDRMTKYKKGYGVMTT